MQPLRPQKVGSDELGYSWLVAKPSAPSARAPAPRPTEILSRAEIARRRNVQSVAPLALVGASEPVEMHDADMAPVATAETFETAEVVEMHVIDVTPIPKNKGGRPRKNQ